MELNLTSDSFEARAVARAAGLRIFSTGSWGLRPRLYAFVRSADSPTSVLSFVGGLGSMFYDRFLGLHLRALAFRIARQISYFPGAATLNKSRAITSAARRFPAMFQCESFGL